MFRIDQILTATTFIRSFRHVAKYLAERPEPLLITQKNGRFLVVMDSECFESLMILRASPPEEIPYPARRSPYDFKS